MEHHLTFGPFCLNVTHGRLWRGTQGIPLRPRSVAVLQYLVEHPDRLVTKAELREQVWAGTHVTDSVLRASVKEIRAALSDAATAPHYLETVGRQGYRFLAGGERELPPSLTTGLIVGRQREVGTLEQWFQSAVEGHRRLGFVSGEIGIGKTTVVDLFLARHAAGSGVRIARGQCVESYGEGEPYLPLLQAIGRFGYGPEGASMIAVLRRYAPMWLVQCPGLVSETELERLQRQVHGATRARMLRELAQALEVLTTNIPLVLVLEDLHWSDNATVECLRYLGQRLESARLLVLGTYRPVEVMMRRHPLRRTILELCGRGQAVELCLEFLPPEDVTAYLAGRLGGPVAAPLAGFVHERTDGNALFMVSVVEHLVQQGLVVRREGQWTLREGAAAKVASVPENLQQLLVRRLEDLPSAARQVLEAASVVGVAFEVAAVAAGAQCPVEDVNVLCEGLAAQHYLLDDTGWTVSPDGTSGGSYRFQHALYQQVLYEGVGTVRRIQLHQCIGARLEAGYGARAWEIAAQLAVHFERGGEVQRAVHYLQQAGDTAARRNADQEALTLFTTGLTLLATLPESPTRLQQELPLQLALGALWMATKGRMAPEAGTAYTQAHALGQQVGDPPQRFQALWGLMLFHGAQGQVRTASALSQQLFDLAHRQSDPVVWSQGHLAMGVVTLQRGDFVTARAHLEHSLRLAEPTQAPLFRDGLVSGVTPRPFLAQALWALGYADQARQWAQEAVALARQRAHTLSVVYATLRAALLSQCCREVAATQAHADAAMALGATHDLGLRLAQGRMLRGWAVAMQGDAADGVAHLHQGLAADHGVGPQSLRPYFLALLAEAYGQAGHPEAGLPVLAEALTLVATMEAWGGTAELYRLQGALLLQLPRPDVPQAEACLRQALEVARGQQAKTLELRAALRLSQLWQQQGQRQEAHALLAPIYGWFTEGFDTADLQEATALLAALA